MQTPRIGPKWLNARSWWNDRADRPFLLHVSRTRKLPNPCVRIRASAAYRVVQERKMGRQVTKQSGSARKPRGYWCDFGNIRREVLAFIAKKGVSGVMPTITELRRARLGSLVVAFHKYHGDYRVVAGRLHLKIRRRPRGYWKRFDNVRDSVLAVVDGNGAPGQMPTVAALRRNGSGGLAAAIHQYH